MIMTLQEIEERMDELSRRLVETHDKKIIKELYDLALELEKVEKLEKQWTGRSCAVLSQAVKGDSEEQNENYRT
jgi:predicted RNase H-like nuclease (RuvC/YqgF family)